MELLMSNKFMEMNEQEMMDVDGGVVVAKVTAMMVAKTTIVVVTAITMVYQAGKEVGRILFDIFN